MTEQLRNWVLGLAAASAFCAAATLLTPKGRVRQVVRLLCGILMTAALISPLRLLDLSDYGLYLAQYRNRAELLTGEAENITRNLDRSYIQERMAAYILDKAAFLGAAVEDVEVECRWETAGLWVPERVTIIGDFHGELSRALESELGISREEQIWRRNEKP